MDHEHPFKEVRLKGIPVPVPVDVEVVDLVVALNDLEWSTEQSCQHNQGRVWIAFSYPIDAEQFLGLIVKKGSKPLVECVRNTSTQWYHEQPLSSSSPDRWWVDAHVNRISLRNKRVAISIQVRFPREHLEEVTGLVVAKAAAQGH